MAVAAMGRNTAEAEEFQAEAVVNTCLAFVERASELWQKSPVELQNRLQVVVCPEGVGFEVLERQANPEVSLVHAVFTDATRMAAPAWRVANPVIGMMVESYRLLKELPPAGDPVVTP